MDITNIDHIDMTYIDHIDMIYIDHIDMTYIEWHTDANIVDIKCVSALTDTIATLEEDVRKCSSG